MTAPAIDLDNASLSLGDAATLDRQFQEASAEELLRWAIEAFGDRVVVASSFGAEDVVLVHMVAQIDPNARIFLIDTGRLPQETYDVMDRLREKYGVTFEVVAPNHVAVQDMVRRKGANSFYASVESRRECCHVRKVEPLQRILRTADAWVTGLRRGQSVTRTDTPKIEVDLTNRGILKLNPLAEWTEEDVWAYIRENDVPYNALHDQGYPSIGCAPCTRAVRPGEDLRAGRWWWESPAHKECGLHPTKEHAAVEAAE